MKFDINFGINTDTKITTVVLKFLDVHKNVR